MILNWLHRVSRWMIQRRMVLIKVFWVGLVGGSLGMIVLSLVWQPFPYVVLGRQAAKVAIVLYLATLVPGILRRFGSPKLLLDVQLAVAAFRRQLGIGMFVAALFHIWWSWIMPLWPSLPALIPRTFSDWFGLLAALLLLPLFATSNHMAKQWLAANWKRLHQLTHLIVWLLLLHVLLRYIETTTVLVVMGAVADAASFGYQLWQEENTLTSGSRTR